MPDTACTRPHVLVIDDDPAVTEALALALASRYEVHAARNGAEACDVLSAHRVAAIVLDAILGDEHGLELLPRLRTLSPAPVLMLTGNSTEALAVQALRAQVADYLRKPPSLPALHTALARLVERPPTAPCPFAQTQPCLNAEIARSLALPTLADSARWSERHFRRRFHTAHGTTPRQYLLARQVELARWLLRASALRIQTIATIVGFPNALGLARAFKGAVGTSPSVWRQATANPKDRPPSR
jgi:DNA-binding response OmpR family regulator